MHVFPTDNHKRNTVFQNHVQWEGMAHQKDNNEIEAAGF